jgi:L-lactate utilization protein LutC
MNYTTLPNLESLNKTVDSLKAKNFIPVVVANRADALAKIRELIPAGESINNGSSRTLEEIGFIDLLKSNDQPWDNLHAKILSEADPAKQAELRKQALFANYYLGSVHAVTENGELVIASASGSQLPHIAFTSPNLIFVVGAQKIVPNLDTALARVRDYVYPLEDARIKSTGAAGSVLSKILIVETEPAFMKRNVHVILVNELLGF